MRTEHESRQSEEMANAVRLIANAITDMSAAPGRDASDGRVGCLTEAVMGATAGLHAIAQAIDRLAAATEELQLLHNLDGLEEIAKAITRRAAAAELGDA